MKPLLKMAAACAGLFATLNSALAQTWTQTSAPITNWQSVTSSADGTKLVAATGGYLGVGVGPIYISTNSGISWIQSSAPITNWLHVASSADGSRLVAAGYHIYYSTNSGNDWTQASAPFPFEFWSSVVSSADGTKLAIGALGGTFPRPRTVYLSTDSGATWHPAGLNGSALASSADGTRLMAIEYNAATNLICWSTNSGITWKSNNPASSQSWWAAASSADGVKLTAAGGGVFLNSTGPIYTSTNSGMTWMTNKTPNVNWSSIASSADGTRLAAAGKPGSIYTSQDSGATWISNNVPVTNWASIASSADGNNLVAVVNGGGVYVSQSSDQASIIIRPSRNELALSWLVPSRKFVLQQNSDLSTTNWVTFSNTPMLNLTNLQNEVFLSPPASNGFFRLATP